MHEKELLSNFQGEIAKGTEMIVFGPSETLFSCEMGAVETLIIYEELDYRRVEVQHPTTKETKILYLRPDQLTNPKMLEEDGIEMEVID